LNCKSTSAFDYFTKLHLLIKWLTVKAHTELKQGGAYDLFWTPQDPDSTNNSIYSCKILALEKPYYLNVEWKGNKDHKRFMNNVQPLTNVTFIFSQKKESKTKVTILHTGWRDDDKWNEARKFFTNAWTVALKKLEALCTK